MGISQDLLPQKCENPGGNRGFAKPNRTTTRKEVHHHDYTTR